MEGLGVGMRSVAGRDPSGFTTGACGFTHNANQPLQWQFGPPDAGGRRLPGRGPAAPNQIVDIPADGPWRLRTVRADAVGATGP